MASAAEMPAEAQHFHQVRSNYLRGQAHYASQLAPLAGRVKGVICRIHLDLPAEGTLHLRNIPLSQVQHMEVFQILAETQQL